MVGIVSGNSLGLNLTSWATLGGRGALDASGSAAQERNGERVAVNVANGNLVLQELDDRMAARGVDVETVRTYNSQGALAGRAWQVGPGAASLRVEGGWGAVGSTATRVERDGASAAYRWDGARRLYVATAGAGAFDTVRLDAAAQRLVWTDGDSGLVEHYESSGAGRLLAMLDADGNAQRFAYVRHRQCGYVSSVGGADYSELMRKLTGLLPKR